MDRIVIIDGNSLINRAYYAMQRPMITKDGIFTQGIYGFLNMLNKIIEDYNPQYLAVTFDKKTPTFRHKAYKDYKAGRKKMPPELAMQMPILKDILHAMNIKTVELDGYEADDLIGTIAKKFEGNDIEPLIITGDKDALQLCTDKTKVIFTKKGITVFDVYDKDKMREVYSLTPKQFIDLKGLMGDKSDNIPGLPGVGEKTGLKLLEQFENIENLINNTDKISNKTLRQKVEDNIDLILLSKKLATINTSVPIDVNFDEYKLIEPNIEELKNIYTKLEFNKFLNKLTTKLNDTKSLPDKKLEIIEVESFENLAELKNKDCYIKVFSDDNHKAKPAIFCIGICCDDKIYFIEKMEGNSLNELVEFLNELKLNCIGHQLKKDLYTLMSYGYNSFNIKSDVEIMAYLLQPSRSSYEFSNLVSENLFCEIQDEKELADSNAQVSFLSDNYDQYKEYLKKYFVFLEILDTTLAQKIKNEKLDRIYYEIELPLIRVLADMELNGIDVDVQMLESIGKSLEKETNKLEKEIFSLAGEEFKINSPKQLGIILFEKLQLPALKKNKSGYSTNADVLLKLKNEHPIVSLVLKYRTFTKLNSTYVEGIKPLLDENNRIHAHFQQTVTATGRMSCTEPNLQNIPVRDPIGKELRKCYVAKDGYVLVGADYSQIELRVLAELSGDKDLIDAFKQGEDIHKLTASKILGIDKEKVTDEDRRKAKAVNFGVIYGMSSFGLSEEVGISRKDAQRYINDYFQKYSNVKDYMDNQIALTKERGYTLTALGRKRYVNELKSSNYMVRQFGERLAMNTPIQGTAADIIKIAMIKVYNNLKSENIDAKLILQVHDELILRVDENYSKKAMSLLEETMEKAIDMNVPLKADPESGKSWYDLK